ELPRLSIFSPTLVVDSEFSLQALQAIAAMRDSDPGSGGKKRSWTIRQFTADGSEIAARKARKHPARIAAITCLRHHIAANGRDLSTSALNVAVELWDRLGRDKPRADGASHIAGTRHRRQPDHDLAVDYIEPTAWFHAVRDDHRLKLPAPHLYTLQEPVDIVYTWVDGADPKWRSRMREAMEAAALRAAEPSALAESRFTSRDELKYSLRSLEYYASWANHIYIVTDDQVPDWLNTDHPKVTVVDHLDIFT